MRDKPKFESLDWRRATRLSCQSLLWEEKIDGEWRTIERNGHTIIGESLPDMFCPFDCLSLHGEDLRARPLSERRRALTEWVALASESGFQDVKNHGFKTSKIRLPATGSGGEFLEAILANGGEGVVVKDWSSPWGAPWIKIKRSRVYYCRVTELLPWVAGAEICDSITGEKRGKIALRGKFDSVRVGSVLKVEAYGLHASGLLREARLDNDSPGSWLNQY